MGLAKLKQHPDIIQLQTTLLWSINARLGALLPTDIEAGLDFDEPNSQWLDDVVRIAVMESNESDGYADYSNPQAFDEDQF